MVLDGSLSIIALRSADTSKKTPSMIQRSRCAIGRSFMKPSSRATLLSRLIRSPQRYWQFDEGPVARLAFRLSRGIGKVRGSYVWQQAVTTCARKLGCLSSGNFLVLGAARSGTTLLVDYLNCHPR